MALQTHNDQLQSFDVVSAHNLSGYEALSANITKPQMYKKNNFFYQIRYSDSKSGDNFRRVRKIAKGDYQLCHVSLPLSVRPHEKLGRMFMKFDKWNFSKI